MDSPRSRTNPFQFTGRENDGTGLYYYRARYYSPELQRFISQDPIGFGGGGPNLYAYVANDPETLVDRKGLSEVPSWLNPSSPDYNPSLYKIAQQQLNNPYLSCPLQPKPPCKLTPAQYVDFVNGLGDWGTVGFILGGVASAPSLDPPAVVGVATGGAGVTDFIYYKTFMFLHCG